MTDGQLKAALDRLQAEVTRLQKDKQKMEHKLVELKVRNNSELGIAHLLTFWVQLPKFIGIASLVPYSPPRWTELSCCTDSVYLVNVNFLLM